MGKIRQYKLQQAKPDGIDLRFKWEHSFFDIADMIREGSKNGRDCVVIAFQDAYLLDSISENHGGMADSVREAISSAGLPPGDLSIERDGSAPFFAPYSLNLVYRLKG